MFSLPTSKKNSSEPVEPKAPSLDEAREKAVQALPKTVEGDIFPASGATAKEYEDAYESLGLGVSAYMGLIKHWYQLSGLCLILSIPSMVSNAYGGMLDDMQSSMTTYIFTFTTLGNNRAITPAYGATEFCISCIVSMSLFTSLREMTNAALVAEKKQITHADFALEVEFTPGDETSVDLAKEAIADAVAKTCKAAEAREAAEAEDAVGTTAAAMAAQLAAAKSKIIGNKALHVSVPLEQRELTLAAKQWQELNKLIEARTADLDALSKFGEEKLSKENTKRFKGLKDAKDADDAAKKKLAEQISAEADKKEKVKPAGLAYVTMTKQKGVDLMLKDAVNDNFKTTGNDSKGATIEMTFRRPPEPTDIIWPNLGSASINKGRQVRATIYCLLLSCIGSVVIGGMNFVQPIVLEWLDDSSLYFRDSAQQAFGLLGTVIVIAGYLLIFIVVPIMEENFMRHRTISNREQSQVVKLVVFQVIATVATSTVFLLETGGAFTRSWYLTGGFLLINGMMVDTGFITVVVQGYQLNGVLLPQLLARYHSPPLTQYEADVLMAPKSDMYVTDRLQMVTKFVCMTYIYASAMPQLWAVLFVVCTLSLYLDNRNLLRVLQPPPQSDVSQVKVILQYIMPTAALLHLVFQYVMLSELMDGVDRDWLADMTTDLGHTFGNLTDTTTSLLTGVASGVATGLTSFPNVSSIGTSLTSAVGSTTSNIAGFGSSLSLLYNSTATNVASVDLAAGLYDSLHEMTHTDAALWLVTLSIEVNLCVILFFVFKTARPAIGLPSIAAKLRVKQNLEKAKGAVLDAPGTVINTFGRGLGFKEKDAADASKQVKQGFTEAFDAAAGLRSTVFGDHELQAQKEKNAAEDLSYADFCTKHHKSKRLNYNDDPYKPPIPPETIEKVIGEAKLYLGPSKTGPTAMV